MKRWFILSLVLLLAGCHPHQAVLRPPAPVTLPPEGPAEGGVLRPPIPKSTGLTKASYSLIIEFEVGGVSSYSPHPEAPDARFSGITWGVGYDAHQNSKARILGDWAALPTAPRLAATQPYYGRSAQAHLSDVSDILVKWALANDVFLNVDVAREFASCRRAYTGFDSLRPNAQGALISLGFNRGYSTAGPTRVEMRQLVKLVPHQDYAGMAKALRDMKQVWRGTSIEHGMARRREAEAQLIERG